VRHETFENLSTEHWDGEPLRIFPIHVHVAPRDDAPCPGTSLTGTSMTGAVAVLAICRNALDMIKCCLRHLRMQFWRARLALG
jgi:hypothetical protein